jgi:hypothetical protein
MFNHGRFWRLFNESDPTGGIKMFREMKLEHFLSPDELTCVNEALAEESKVFWRTYTIESLVANPPRCASIARWAALIWTTGDGDFQLQKQAAHICYPCLRPPLKFSGLYLCGKTEWVFPGSGSNGHLPEPKQAWQRIRQRAQVGEVRIHDLRRVRGAGFQVKDITRYQS